jgi:hypothetical protein
MIKKMLVLALFLVVGTVTLAPVKSLAADSPACYGQDAKDPDKLTEVSCGSVTTSDGKALENDKCYQITPIALGAAVTLITCPSGGKIASEVDKAFGGCQEGSANTGCGVIEKYLNPLINLLAGAVGLVVIIMIIYGGIQYSMAGGDSGKVSAAKARISNALFALIAFLFLYAVLQWLVPGGLF